MNTQNVHAGRLERRVRRVGSETMPVFMDFALFSHSAQYASLLRPTALKRQLDIAAPKGLV